MNWITENPWPLLLILLGTALVLMIVGEPRLRRVALGCVVAAVGLYFLESAIVTPGEHVEQNLQKMLSGFVREDLESINGLIASGSPGLKEQARRGLSLARLHEGFHLKDVAVTVSQDGLSADVHLRANGGLTVREGNTPFHAVTRWETQWALENGVWKLSKVRRLDPVSGTEIGILDAG